MTDLGGRSLGNSYETVLKGECDFFEFDMIAIWKTPSKIGFYKAYIGLIFDLRKNVKRTVRSGGKVIFQNLKPALFTFGIWNSKNSILISDFSHSIFTWHRHGVYKEDLRLKSQKYLFNKLYRIIALTDNLANNLHEVYKVDKSKIRKAPLPLDFEYFYQEPKITPIIPKVLFVGGEFYRKGGNHLLKAWDDKLKGKCELIILTKETIESKDGITTYNNLSKGDELHKQLFRRTDIFILPTNKDAYPVVLGEAAAASMAIITTQYALGAKNIIEHGKSGFVAETPENCIDYLVELLDKPELIDQFKKETHNNIVHNFSKEQFKKLFFNAIK